MLPLVLLGFSAFRFLRLVRLLALFFFLGFAFLTADILARYAVAVSV